MRAICRRKHIAAAGRIDSFFRLDSRNIHPLNMFVIVDVCRAPAFAACDVQRLRVHRENMLGKRLFSEPLGRELAGSSSFR